MQPTSKRSRPSPPLASLPAGENAKRGQGAPLAGASAAIAVGPATSPCPSAQSSRKGASIPGLGLLYAMRDMIESGDALVGSTEKSRAFLAKVRAEIAELEGRPNLPACAHGV